MKTRQQKLAEERAGHPFSPPQALVDNPRGPNRTRAKSSSATAAVGSVVPAAQLDMPGEPQALLHVWLDASRAADDPTHTYAIPKSLLPEVRAFIEANQGGQDLPATSSRSSLNQKPQARPPPLDLLTNAELPHYFRGRPHLPAYTKDGTALYGLVPTPAKAPGPIQSPEDPQINDEASANKAFADEDIEMGNASEDNMGESDSSAEQLAESPAQEAMEPTSGRTPKTPRGRSWGFGSLYQSARSLAGRFGFSPLTPVSERFEPTTPSKQATPTLAKKKASISVPAKATRAKSLRHSNSVAKLVKPVTNQGGQAPRGKKASPAPEMSRGEEEIPQTKSGKPTQPLCWPSRSLERTLGSGKRKRCGDPCTEQQSAKLRRIGDKIDFSSQQSGVKTPIPITNSAGTFKVPSPSDSDWSDSDEEERGFKVPMSNDSDEEVQGFKVPLPSDSDWIDSDWSDSDEEVQGFKVPLPRDCDWIDSDWSDSDEQVQGFKVPLPSDSDWGSGDEDDENVKSAVNAVDNYGQPAAKTFISIKNGAKQQLQLLSPHLEAWKRTHKLPVMALKGAWTSLTPRGTTSNPFQTIFNLSRH